ncbi:hypothetical protein [Bacillus tequilensis]|uniref:hypothetical protein n=1 Tax=Bacillus tequilensis TaxID=227866 RepID=UPI0004B6559E|nr:hypothetical protein [Bacillus tequilensis]SPT99101.1 Uncharacterised protein [Bacillus tequilensis]
MDQKIELNGMIEKAKELRWQLRDMRADSVTNDLKQLYDKRGNYLKTVGSF